MKFVVVGVSSFSSSSRLAGGAGGDPPPWIYIWKPGQYPKTQEEHEAAAKKYNLIPEDYQPYPDDGLAPGDYPLRKTRVCPATRSGFYDWDYQWERRNYGEFLDEDAEIVTEINTDLGKHRYTKFQLILRLIGIVALFYVPVYLTKDFKYYQPVARKQVPGEGKHYTFEFE